MRNISFSATTEKLRTHQKHVTRRLIRPGHRSIWTDLQPDERLMGVEKGQGLKKGEKVVQLGEIVVLDATPEPLDEIIRCPLRINNYTISFDPKYFLSEVTMEGFPDLTPQQFVDIFCEMNKCKPDAQIVRILFDYVGKP